MFDRSAYLARIAYDGPVDPTLQTLADLTLAHLRTVPFENLDIVPLGRPLRLDREGLYRKIVKERRGGFCFELNGLFAILLEELGFAVTRVASQFAREGGGYGPPIDHLSLLVTPPGGAPRYVDAGAGSDSPATPLIVPGPDAIGPPGPPDVADGSVTRIERRGSCGHVWRREPGATWTEHMRFDFTPRTLSDFADRCRYYETLPDSPFRRGPLCSRLTPDGRVSIRPGMLTVTTDGARTETPLPDDAALREALRTHFAIDLDRFSRRTLDRTAGPQGDPVP